MYSACLPLHFNIFLFCVSSAINDDKIRDLHTWQMNIAVVASILFFIATDSASGSNIGITFLR